MTDFSTTLPLRRARKSLLQRAAFLIAVAKSRRDLAKLGDERLSDVGISPRKASEEVARGFWDVPASWRK